MRRIGGRVEHDPVKLLLSWRRCIPGDGAEFGIRSAGRALIRHSDGVAKGIHDLIEEPVGDIISTIAMLLTTGATGFVPLQGIGSAAIFFFEAIRQKDLKTRSEERS